jgi:hypothetical protein
LSLSAPAVLKRWTWLLVAAAVGASAIAALAVLHDREVAARTAETRATTFAAELRGGVRALTALAPAVSPADRARVVPPVVAQTAGLGERRLRRLDAVLGAPSRTDLLHRRLRFLPRLAATTRSPAVIDQRLTRAGEQIAGGAERIARDEHARATAIARAALLASGLVVGLAIALVALALLRRDRRHARALREPAHAEPALALADRRRPDEDLAAAA